MEALDLEDKRGPGAYQLYLQNSSAPLAGFLFSLPLFIVYHAGLWWLNTFVGLKWANAVDIGIADWLGKLGMAGPLLSFITVVIVFLTMHAMSGKAWKWPPVFTWLLMIMESLIMALPVFMLSRLTVNILSYLPLNAAVLPLPLSATGDATFEPTPFDPAFPIPEIPVEQYTPAVAAGAEEAMSWQSDLVLSCGAGVYEEFFFRVLVMGLMVLILEKAFGVRSGWKFAIAAVSQALLFSATHHLPGSPEAILTIEQAKAALPVFSFRTVAGIYFAFVYIERGFGIAAGTHAFYDLMVVMLDVFMPEEFV